MLHNTITSIEFQRLLGTDATTKEGQDYIAEYYNVATNWEELKKQGEEKGTIADAASAYYYLLITVKCESKKDNIWMTFYEGLHQHSALILSLLSSTFNIKENVFKKKSLNSQYFKEQQLVNFKDEVSQPHERLNAIFAKTRNTPMITSTFHGKGMVLKPVTKSNEFTVPDFIEMIIKYSELMRLRESWGYAPKSIFGGLASQDLLTMVIILPRPILPCALSPFPPLNNI
jgi:hypothetical protein